MGSLPSPIKRTNTGLLDRGPGGRVHRVLAWAGVVLACAGVVGPASGQTLSLLAGGPAEVSSIGRAAVSSLLGNPAGLWVDGEGNLYVADSAHHQIRRLRPDGTMETLVGKGAEGFSPDGVPAMEAALGTPFGVAVGGGGTLYFADTFNNRIRKVTSSGHIVTVAGTGQAGYSGDGGVATQAALNTPTGIHVDPWGALLVADTFNSRIRRIDLTGDITTVAGSGVQGFGGDGGAATDAMLAYPLGVCVDGSGRILIADKDNHRVRVVDPAGSIQTLAGNGHPGFSGDGGPAIEAALRAPSAVGADSAGSVYVADRANGRVRRIDPDGSISTVMGGGLLYRMPGSADPEPSLLEGPYGLFAGRLGVTVADTETDRILRLQPPARWPRLVAQPASIRADGQDASTIRIEIPGALPGASVALHVLEGDARLPSARVALRNDWTATQLTSARPGTLTIQAIASTASGDASATATLVVDPVRALKFQASRLEFPANGIEQAQLLVEQQSLGSGPHLPEAPLVHLSVVSGQARLATSEFPFSDGVSRIALSSTTPGAIRLRAEVEGAFPRFLDLAAAVPLPGQVPDAFEFDDEREAAGVVTTGGERSARTLHRAGDVDWVAFQARPGYRYTVSAESGAAVDIALDDPGTGSAKGVGRLAATHHGDAGRVSVALSTARPFAPYVLQVAESPDILLRPRADGGHFGAWGVDGGKGMLVELDLVDSDGRVHSWDSATEVSFRLLGGVAELADTVVTAERGSVGTRLKPLRTGDVTLVARASVPGGSEVALRLRAVPAVILDLDPSPGDQAARRMEWAVRTSAVDVDLVIPEGLAGAVGFRALLGYDPKILRFESFEPAGAMSGAEAIVDRREGSVEVTAAILDGHTGESGGSVGRVRFEIVTPEPGATRIQLQSADVGFGSGTVSVPVGRQTGLVQIDGGSGALPSLADYVARLGPALNSSDGDRDYDIWVDVNRDGRIDIVDLVLYAQMLRRK